MFFLKMLRAFRFDICRLSVMFITSLCFLIVAEPLALAATAPVAVSVDVNFWYQGLLTIILLVVPSFLTYAVFWMQAHFKWARSAHAATVLDLFKTSAIQGLTQLVSGLPSTVDPVVFKNTTIGDLVKTASADVQAAMKVKGITAETIGQQIAGGLALAVPPVPPATLTVAPAAPPKAA